MGSQIYVSGPCAPLYAPERKIFYTRGENVTMTCDIFNFNFLALVCSEILRGSQIYTRGAIRPLEPPSGEIFLPSEYFTISNCI